MNILGDNDGMMAHLGPPLLLLVETIQYKQSSLPHIGHCTQS